MQAISGVYLGWTPPNESRWEPLFRTTRVAGGYQSDPTKWYAPRLAQYPGLELALSFNANPLELPYILSRRTPLNRPDYERNARSLGLPYPNLDLFEYIGRTGGLFSGDPFSVCPIVKPNHNGKYSYECGLEKVNNEVAKYLRATTELKTISAVGVPAIITADGRTLGRMLPHFEPLKNGISNVQLINIGEKHQFGGGHIIVSFDANINLYAYPQFDLVKKGATVGV